MQILKFSWQTFSDDDTLSAQWNKGGVLEIFLEGNKIVINDFHATFLCFFHLCYIFYIWNKEGSIISLSSNINTKLYFQLDNSSSEFYY